MLTATLWGLVGGVALLVGAVIGVYVKVSYKVIGLVLAFGSGVLFSAVAFELTQRHFSPGAPHRWSSGSSAGPSSSSSATG